MSISPILPGRLANVMLGRRLLQNIQSNQSSLARLQDMAASGQRIFRPGEDPAGATRTVFFQKEIEQNTQLIDNVATARSLLTATETNLQSVADAMNSARSFISAGIGDSTTAPEKQAMALEVQSLIQQVLSNANATFRGRNLFGGTLTEGVPFELQPGGTVLYRGNAGSIESHLGASLLLANNIDGETAFGALTTPITRDLDPAVTLETRLSNLHGNAGVPLGPIRLTVDDGVNPAATVTVDLAGAETVRDVKTRIEAAFSSGTPGLAVSINPAGNGLQLTPSGGTVTVSDFPGGLTADRLGIASPPVATIAGADLNPTLTPITRLSDLNGGSGIDTTGLRITSGKKTAIIDLSGATTVEDALNAIRSQARTAGVEVSARLSDDGTGIEIASRVSGAAFSIGENGGNTATSLGIRTFTAETPLADLNRKVGVSNAAPATLDLTRRDGSAVTVDLSAAKTVQDVLDAINSLDPGILTASLNAIGNGITLIDNDGVSTGDLSVADNPLARSLGMNGTESSGDPSGALIGSDPNPQEAEGILNLLVRLEKALRTADDAELNRLSPEIIAEIDRFSEVRADVASRLQTIEQVDGRLRDRDVSLRENLSEVFDADIAEVLTEVAARQSALEATLKVSAQTSSLLLINYL